MKIFIPDSVEHTQPLTTLVEPMTQRIYMQLCDPKTLKPFSSGKIENRRTAEISMFMFRSKCLIEEAGQVIKQDHLKKGDKVLVCVQAYDKDNQEIKASKVVEVK